MSIDSTIGKIITDDPCDLPFMPGSQAAAYLGVSEPTVRKMANVGMLRKNRRLYVTEDVVRVGVQRDNRFTDWYEAAPLYYAVPISPNSGTLSLSKKEDRALVESKLGVPSEGCDIVGWWPVSEKMLSMLVSNRSVILGVCGGYVGAAVQILSAYRHNMRNRQCAFLVRRIEGEELVPLLGRIEGKTALGRNGGYVTLKK